MAIYKGIDVSHHQGVIDWKKVKKCGKVNFAILRASAWLNTDRQFERNYTCAKAVGLPVGVYHYSYATTPTQARKEARHLLTLLKGKKLEFPVYFDIEDKCQKELSRAACTAITKAFCEEIEKADYWVGVYSYDSFFASNLSRELNTRYATWCARIGKLPVYNRDAQMHQYSWKGRIPGIRGDVDLNTSKIWYPRLVKKAGKNGY